MAITRGEYARARNAVNNAIKNWTVTKNSNGSYTINKWNKAGTTVWWNWTYRWAWGTWTTSTDWASKYSNNAWYQSLVKQYWANNVHDALDYISTNKWGNKTQLSYLLSWGKSTDEKPNIGKLTSGATSWNNKVTEKQEWNYTAASLENYNNALNHYKSQGMSDEDAKKQASSFLESQDLLNNKSEQDKAAEMWPINDEDDFDYYEDIFNWLDEEPYDYHQSQEWQDLMWELDYYKDYADNLSSQLESNTVKTSIPEERDTSYDYNTYYKENLAPDNNYENWESKNTLNDKPQTTLVSQYQEPVTTALNDLGLLTPNEEASASMPNTEEQPAAPETYTSWEELVSDFNNTLEQMWQEGWTWLAPQAVAQTYIDFKNKLDQYANDNNLTAEEKEALLQQLKNNETLNNLLRNK